jgi:hypothetical protein
MLCDDWSTMLLRDAIHGACSCAEHHLVVVLTQPTQIRSIAALYFAYIPRLLRLRNATSCSASKFKFKAHSSTFKFKAAAWLCACHACCCLLPVCMLRNTHNCQECVEVKRHGDAKPGGGATVDGLQDTQRGTHTAAAQGQTRYMGGGPRLSVVFVMYTVAEAAHHRRQSAGLAVLFLQQQPPNGSWYILLTVPNSGTACASTCWMSMS